MSGKVQIWGEHLSEAPDARMVRFCAGRDVTPLPMADALLLPFDLWCNRAHAIMLFRQEIITTSQLQGILAALGQLEGAWQAGTFALDPMLEDVHINVERYVTDKAGADAGGRLHSGRSRNDQVACDMRLYLRAELLALAEGVGELVSTLLDKARTHANTPMPGFSHHQPAMVTSWGHWLGAHAQALCRDLERIHNAYDLLNRNPLGAAAGFGTSWPIDRELTTHLLAFASVDCNTLDCISARWEHEAHVAHVCAMLMNHLSVMAQDIILLSHPYWGMLRLDDAHVSGSSIMPQKRNPDVAEVIKGKAAWSSGMAAGLLATAQGALSGYNRDIQITKYAVMDVLRECLPAPLVLRDVLTSMAVHPEVMAQRLAQGFLTATDFADNLSRQLGLPFRRAYDITAHAVRLSGDQGQITPAAAAAALTAAGQDASAVETCTDARALLETRMHTGAPAKLPVRIQVEACYWRLSTLTAFISKQKHIIQAAHAHCSGFTP